MIAGACLVVAVVQGRPSAQVVLRSSVEMVTVDLVVRDRSGALVSGLTLDDFELLEDGVAQRLAMFDALEGSAPPSADGRPAAPASSAARVTRGAALPVEPRGILVLLFDLTGLTSDELDRAVSAARTYTTRRWSDGVAVGVATITPALEWRTEPTPDAAAVLAAIESVTQGAAISAAGPVPRTLESDEAAALAIDGDLDEARPAEGAAVARDDLATLTNDTRLRALTRLAGDLERYGRKKAVLYFSGGLEPTARDNDVEMRAAVNAAVRANVAIYPVDAGGLQTLVPGGDASRGTSPGTGFFSGADVTSQIENLAGSQETLVTLAAETGGRATLDSNDFEPALTRAAADLSGYYLIGYQSSNPARDGRFRRIQVRVSRPGLRVETRAGYYADIDFAHAASADREAQLLAELAAPLPSTDLPLAVNFGWFRTPAGEYDVPVAVGIPGWDVAPPPDAAAVPIDVIGEIRDEGGRTVSRIRDTTTIRRAGSAALARSLLVYRLTARLLPGRFTLKIVVRENLSGRVGSYEAPLVVPDLSTRRLDASSIILAIADAPAGPRWSPHPTNVVEHDRPLRLSAEVYGPVTSGDAEMHVRAGVRCFQDLRLVYETPVVARTRPDARRRALPVVFDIPAHALRGGIYTCQITAVQEAARLFVAPRITFAVR